MTAAIMQPYLFPYIGYFQLINAVNTFIVYDNIQYTKKGWINRNRILVNGKDEYISFPLKKDSDFLSINQRQLAATTAEDKKKILRKLTGVYSKAPQYDVIFPLLNEVISCNEENLFAYIYNSIRAICNFLDIETSFVVSSSLPIEHQLKAQDKVIALCKSIGATGYINPIGGVGLYSKPAFEIEGIDLWFLKSSEVKYRQFDNEFVPWLSIIDVLMFSEKEKVKEYINKNFTLV